MHEYYFQFYRPNKPSGTKNIPGITKIYFNKPFTIVIFDDGTKTISKCDDADTYDKTEGVIKCIMKKTYGDNYYSKVKKFITKQEQVEEKKAQIKKATDKVAKQNEVNRKKNLKTIQSLTNEVQRLKKELAMYNK